MSTPHSHSHDTPEVSDTVLLWTVIVNFGLSIFEFAAGLISGSVALMADALHNTNDAAALLIAYVARKISKKPADNKFTFGYRRAELIGAMIQLTALIVVGIFLIYEAVSRFLEPMPLKGGWIMAAAGIALIVDVVTAWLLWAMSKGSLNVRAAFLHNISDAGASIAVLLGGAAIYWLKWFWVDPLVTLIIAGYILYMSYGMLIRTSSILMDGVPVDVDVIDIKRNIEKLKSVKELHHIHVWELDEHNRAMEAHIVVEDGLLIQDVDVIRSLVDTILRAKFSITHSTIQIETGYGGCEGKDKSFISVV